MSSGQGRAVKGGVSGPSSPRKKNRWIRQLPTAANLTAGYLGRQPACLRVGKRGHVQLFIHSEIGSDTTSSLLLLCQSEDHSLVNKYLLGTMTSSGLCCTLWGTGSIRGPCTQGASSLFSLSELTAQEEPP